MEQFAFYPEQYRPEEWVLFGCLLLFFLVQLIFYLAVYSRPYRYEKKRNETLFADAELPGISVIVTSKNDAEELKKNLPYILEQDYPRFEVIVVNSGSTDETDMVLKAAEQKYEGLYHTYVPAGADEVNEKKLALTLGIKAAKYDVLLFTEAYCRPSTSKWIRAYGQEFAQGKEIVVGFSKLTIKKNVGMRRFIQFDNLLHHLKFLSMALVDKPFMGIGRNMGYRKELFFDKKGFSSVLNMEGGEDDLFLNRVGRGRKSSAVLSRDGMIETGIVDRFSTWRALKSKYVYTKQFYKGTTAHLFAWDTVSKYAFYGLFIGCIALSAVKNDPYVAGLALLLFIVRFLVQLMVINKNSRMLEARSYHIDLLFFDFFQPINNQRLRKYANRRNRHF